MLFRSGKMHDSPHPSKTIISSKRILELLHVDLFGAVPEASLAAPKGLVHLPLSVSFKAETGALTMFLGHTPTT